MQFPKGYQIKPNYDELVKYFLVSTFLKYFPSARWELYFPSDGAERRVERVNCEYLKREIFLSSPLENILQTAGEKMFSFSQF